MNLDFITSLIDLGGIVGLIGVPYLIISSKTRRKHFDFDFSGSSGTLSDTKENLYTWTFSGTIKNRSESPNTISQIYMIVWKNKKHNSYLRMGSGLKNRDANSDEDLSMPIYFKPREAKKITATYSQKIDPNSADGRILRDMEEVVPGKGLYLHKRWYHLLFEDIDKNCFDHTGKLTDRKQADLWWTLGNSYRKLDDGEVLPTIKHFLNIFYAKFKFVFRRLLWHMGLS